MIVTMSEIEDLRLRREELLSERVQLWEQFVTNERELEDVEARIRASEAYERKTA